MYTILIICIIIVIIILALSLITTSKAYDYKHTIDPIQEEDSHQNYLDKNSEQKGGNHEK
ncbi:YtzI protein [Bacillus sp. PS06]|uniref:YtzI protein n=1 Tax=Bacillus sp. PS06 TaxID=2764176 RepID=UPI0017865447|nr:YtzI protein [Bacillus sp. PS06]MBD8068565.1 YtzI protein [Bacillus sp. PS06]